MDDLVCLAISIKQSDKNIPCRSGNIFVSSDESSGSWKILTIIIGLCFPALDCKMHFDFQSSMELIRFANFYYHP